MARKPFTGEQLCFHRPVFGRPQGWRCAPPPPAADGLDPVRPPVFRLGMRSAEAERDRSHCRRVTSHFWRRAIMVLRMTDELAHAGGERNLLLLSFGDQAVIEGLEHGVVLGRGAKTRHVEEVADLAAPALDVALAPPSAAIVIVRRYPQQGSGDVVARPGPVPASPRSGRRTWSCQAPARSR